MTRRGAGGRTAWREGQWELRAEKNLFKKKKNGRKERERNERVRLALSHVKITERKVTITFDYSRGQRKRKGGEMPFLIEKMAKYYIGVPRPYRNAKGERLKEKGQSHKETKPVQILARNHVDGGVTPERNDHEMS